MGKMLEDCTFEYIYLNQVTKKRFLAENPGEIIAEETYTCN